jgi:L-seryl-tRNA(Ser) seleniumtransferase
MDQTRSHLRQLPSVDALLQMPELGSTLERFGRPALTEAIRTVLTDVREAVKSGSTPNALSICLKPQGNRACARCSI